FPTHFSLYRSFEEEFLGLNSSGLKEAYERLRNGDLNHTIAYMDSVANSGIEEPTDPEVWWETSADALDSLRDYHTGLMSEIQTIVAKVSERESVNLRNVTIYLMLLALIVITILFWVTRSIVRQIRSLQEVAHEIAQGETDIT